MTVNNKIKELLKMDISQLNITDICKILNISRRAFYNWVNKAKETQTDEGDIYTELIEKIYNDKIELKDKLYKQLLSFSETDIKTCVYLFEKIEKELNRFENLLPEIEKK